MTVETLGHPSVLDELAAALAKAPPLGDWMDDAACARLGDRGADVFTADGVLDGDELYAAVRICRHCPVQQCATYAASDRVRAVGRGPAWEQWPPSEDAARRGLTPRVCLTSQAEPATCAGAKRADER